MSSFPITLSTPPHFSGNLPDAVDVVVIGGGIIGVLSAWELATHGKRVLVCEKGRVAAEQSGRNWGWIRQQGRDLAEVPIMVRAMRRWEGLPQAIRSTIGFRQQGITYIARTEARMQQFQLWMEQARPLGVDSRLLSKRELDAIIPNWGGWVGALHTPSDAQAEPFVTAPVLASAAAEAGVVIRENCAVRMLDCSAGSVTGVFTEHGHVRCEQVILAGGAWSSLFLRAHGVRLPQLSVLSSVSATKPVPEITSGAATDERFAIRQRPDGSVILTPWSHHEFFIGPDAFRHFREFLPQALSNFRSTHFRLTAPSNFPDAWTTFRSWRSDQETPFERCRILNPAPSAMALAGLPETFAEAFRHVGRPEITTSWAGMIDVTPDALPVIGHAPIPGLVMATGMSGHGFGFAPGVAQVIGDLVLGRKPSEDIAAFSLSRFGPGKHLSAGSAL